ncbi:MAG TPA: hypothetical protein VMH87_10015 [Pseudomonadales bacterium]|nr:hypothetical protein [Pseudomonadales bacterium]
MNFPLPVIKPIVRPGGLRRVLAGRLLPLLVFLALWTGVVTSRAVTLVVSPSVVSNTYNGIITLQISGLASGVSNVVVQKFLDVNTNGVIDNKDLLVQQFRLTAGQAKQFMNGGTVVTVTNFMPGDISTTPGQITTPLNFQNGDFMQNIVGQYLYKVSSPSGQFTPATNIFFVNNAPFSCIVTGAVVNANNVASNIPNAVLFLFSVANGGINVQEGTVANNAGFYTLRAPPGTYFFGAAASNMVENLAQQSPFSMIVNFTNNVNVPLTPEATNVTGKVVNAATNSIKIPGVNGLTESTNGFLSFYTTDTNGNFVMPVSSSIWEAGVDNFAAQFAGYLTLQTNKFFSVTNKTVNVTNALPQATAIFYGTVTDSSGNPMPGVYMIATDNANHQSLGLTDKGGNYVLGVIGETNQWNLAIFNPNNPGLSGNYMFSPGYIQTNINTGQALQQNFSVQLAPYFITGTVQTTGGTPIGGVQVFVTGTNSAGVPYQAFTATTAASGIYTNYISPGNWTVGVNASSLENLGYTNIPATVSTNLLTGGDAVINFSVLVCTELAIITTNLPDATVGIPYDTTLQATSCQAITNWLAVYGITLTGLFDKTNVTYTNGTPIYSTGQKQGYLLSPYSYGLNKSGTTYTPFTSNCTANVSTAGGTVYFSDIAATINVSGPIASNVTVTINGRTWTTTSAPSQVAAGNYQTSVFRQGSPDVYATTSKVLSFQATYGMLITGSGKTNTVAKLTGSFPSLATGSSMNLATSLAYAGTNGAVVWLKSGTNWGQYLISTYGPQTTNLPPGLYFTNNEGDTIDISGTPTSTGTNNGLFNFTVEAVDANGNSGVQTLSLVVNANTNQPSLAAVGTLSSNVFQMQVSDVLAGVNYKLLMSTNLSTTNWTSLFTTNASGTTLMISDVNATNRARFYRVQVVQ